MMLQQLYPYHRSTYLTLKSKTLKTSKNDSRRKAVNLCLGKPFLLFGYFPTQFFMIFCFIVIENPQSYHLNAKEITGDDCRDLPVLQPDVCQMKYLSRMQQLLRYRLLPYLRMLQFRMKYDVLFL